MSYIVVPEVENGRKRERFIRIDTISEAHHYPEEGTLHIIQGDPNGECTEQVLSGEVAAKALKAIRAET